MIKDFSKKHKFRNKILDILQIPDNIFSDISPIDFSGNKEVVIEDCKGIIEYDNKIIMLHIGCNTIAKFSGVDLNIKSLTDKNLIIEGSIISLEFLT
jgi:sporulation protein YqfC